MTDLNLRSLTPDGRLILVITAKDTPQNEAIHAAFKEMSAVECRNDYTLALSKLLEYYEEDAKIAMMYHEIEALRHEVASLGKKLESLEPKKDEEGAF